MEPQRMEHDANKSDIAISDLSETANLPDSAPDLVDARFHSGSADLPVGHNRNAGKLAPLPSRHTSELQFLGAISDEVKTMRHIQESMLEIVRAAASIVSDLASMFAKMQPQAAPIQTATPTPQPEPQPAYQQIQHETRKAPEREPLYHVPRDRSKDKKKTETVAKAELKPETAPTVTGEMLEQNGG